MDGKFVVTVLGSDKVGIVAGVSQKLSEMKINIVDISQSIFEGGIFAMIMLVNSKESEYSSMEIKKMLEEFGEELKVKIYVQHEDLFNSMHRI